ncbi:hypothetical protein AGR7A_pAt20290 [Agrobacterium deltaense NCPPB 1641]|uniref:Uncharacterized protein n=1 Tax=Agrobacterium deltaense NCPPB 1641 TaxID=1183425 RepID=A0A1S7U9W2_9HYPH|nr:hypothetical protein AGR7A_pAt20290 [Agrobacterium deltaense NCPPB 1641]
MSKYTLAVSAVCSTLLLSYKQLRDSRPDVILINSYRPHLEAPDGVPRTGSGAIKMTSGSKQWLGRENATGPVGSSALSAS